MTPLSLERGVILIPAFNEEESLPALLEEVKDELPDMPVVVINDSSKDRTVAIAREAGAVCLDLPINLGVAGAMQAGYRYALEQGFDYAVRIDSDGQHPPASIPTLIEAMKEQGTDLVVGSRFLVESEMDNSIGRRIGIAYLSRFLSMICKYPVTDPTSGFLMTNRLLMEYFSERYPADYPEPESLALLRRQGYRFCEVGVPFRNRFGGTSSLHGSRSLYFAIKVSLALLVDRARGVDERYSRHALLEKQS